MTEEQDTRRSKGMRVKEDGRVLSELAASLGNQANVACRIENFGNVVKNLSSLKERGVAEMGFGGLLNLVENHSPRSLCYWLATRVDCEKKELVTPDGLKFPLSKVQVHWVFGLPYGPYPVPNEVRGKRMKEEVKTIRRRHGSVTKDGTREIRGQVLIDADNLSDRLEFKRAFFMFALNEFMDVAYGEIHPNEARNAFPLSESCKQSKVNLRATHQYYIAPPPHYKRKKRQKATNGNPYERGSCRSECLRLGVVDTKQRAWLLCEDLLNDFNNAKDQVKALLQSNAVYLVNSLPCSQRSPFNVDSV